MHRRSYRYFVSLFTLALLLGTGNAHAAPSAKRHHIAGASIHDVRWETGARRDRLHLGRLHLGRLHLG